MKTSKAILSSLLMASLTLSAAAGWGAAPSHDHGGHGDGAAALSLNQGRKWPTDAPLRQGMEGIRRAVAQSLERIHANKLDAAGYTGLAKKLDDQVAYIVGNCHLAPDADAQLHIVLARIGAGIDSMKSKNPDDGRKGAVEVVQALDAYGKHFDHPGWKPLAH